MATAKPSPDRHRLSCLPPGNFQEKAVRGHEELCQGATWEDEDSVELASGICTSESLECVTGGQKCSV